MSRIPNHVAIVPNGNRRGSSLRNISLVTAYMHGARRALQVAGWAKEAGVEHLSFFGLSCENMQNRPSYQIDALMKGATWFFDQAVKLGYHIRPFGNLDEFEGVEKYKPLYDRLKKCRETEYPEDGFVVHVAVNYSGLPMHELKPLLGALRSRGFPEVLKDPTLMRYLLSGDVPPVDLFIRTGGERRLSGLLPFQSAYAELYFTDVLWGDFSKEEFLKTLQWFAGLTRNFGK